MERKHKSPSFPQASLREAVEKVATLYKAIGVHPTSREVVAKGLGYSGISGASATTIGTLNRFGLLDGRGDEVKISDRAMAILHPHSEHEKREALRAAAIEPDLFRELAEKFPGAAPNDELLRNYLIRNRFSEQAAEIAIRAYKETIEFVGGINGGYDSAPSLAEEPKKMQSHAHGVSPSSKEADTLPSGERQLGRWDFEDGGYLRIIVSSDVDTIEALDMVETLVTLRRKELERKRRQETEGDN